MKIINKAQIAIVGAGAAGMMAALRGVLNNDMVYLFPGTAKDKKRSRAKWVSKIENIPGFFHYKKGITEPNNQTLHFIQNCPYANNLIYKNNTGVVAVKKNENNQFIVTDNNSEEYTVDYLVLATGVMDVQPKIEGEIKHILPYANIQLIDYCIRCDGHHILGNDFAVIGEDDDALWVVIILLERYRSTNAHLLTNGANYSPSGKLKKIAEMYGIKIITTPIKSTIGDSKEGNFNGFQFVDDTKTLVNIAFVALGMIVYNELAKQLGAEIDERGFVKTNKSGESLNVPGLYAIGDLQSNTKKQIYTSWDMAVDALDNINKIFRAKERALLLESWEKTLE